MQSLGRRPRKRLSQSFLESQPIAAAIVEAAQLGPSDEVLEVGPGLGVLTNRLARLAKRVVAVELDADLAAALEAIDNIEVVVADILKFEPAEHFDKAFVVVANLPYHITSPAIRHLLAARPSRLILMVQSEVAERIAAQPGDLSALAVIVQTQAAAEIVMRVPRTAFYPQPKVDSAVLRLTPRLEPLIPPEEHDAFERLVHAGFQQPRKTVRNSLADGLGISTTEAAALLTHSAIDPQVRPQDVALDDWVRLYRSR